MKAIGLAFLFVAGLTVAASGFSVLGLAMWGYSMYEGFKV